MVSNEINMAYQSSFTGAQVDELLTKIQNSNSYVKIEQSLGSILVRKSNVNGPTGFQLVNSALFNSIISNLNPTYGSYYKFLVINGFNGGFNGENTVGYADVYLDLCYSGLGTLKYFGEFKVPGLFSGYFDSNGSVKLKKVEADLVGILTRSSGFITTTLDINTGTIVINTQSIYNLLSLLYNNSNLNQINFTLGFNLANSTDQPTESSVLTSNLQLYINSATNMGNLNMTGRLVHNSGSTTSSPVASFTLVTTESLSLTKNNPLVFNYQTDGVALSTPGLIDKPLANFTNILLSNQDQNLISNTYAN